ncbi:MAG TPA: UvrD-helicase domain-containing protein [Trueperaceae bacterium]
MSATERAGGSARVCQSERAAAPAVPDVRRDRGDLTPEQARAAFAPGSVAVVAGAGTGKTKMLAHRYLHHIEEGLSPLEVVAATFTDKAAAELRSRIRALVRERRPRDRRSLVELEAAQIGTIHALAARVCRDHPEEAGVAPDFTVLDDLERVVWRADRLEEAIAELPEDVLGAMPLYLLRAVLEKLLDDPLTAAEALTKGPDDWRSLLAREREASFERIADDPRWREWRATLTAHRGGDGDKAEEARLNAVAAIDALLARDPERALAAAKAVRLNGGRESAWPDGGLRSVKAAAGEVRDAVKAVCGSGPLALSWGPADDGLADLLPHLRTAYEHVSRRLERARREARVLGFADMELHALRALEHERVREHYRERWKAVLVDEFQDTNPVQARILGHLMGGARFTVVGDEKQSIYGFRGADVAVFRRFRDRIVAGGGEEVVLTRTFRAHEGLAREQEPVLAALLGDLHQPLTAVRSPPGAAERYLEFHACVGTGTSRVRRLNEARLVAELVRGLVEDGTLVADPDSGEVRRLRYGDVAVLARGNAPFETFAAVLPSLGVPAVEVAGGDLLGAREAKDGEACLRFLADTADGVALAALLRSPFFAVDDGELLELARSAPQGTTLWQHLAAAPEATARLDRAREVLARALERRWDELPSRLLQGIDEAAGYSAVVANLPGGRRRLADWRAFLALVRKLEGWHRDAFAVARQLRRLRSAGVAVDRPTLHAGDAVTLMTIHGSKGLEWPVVVVADLSFQAGRDDPSVSFDAALGLGIRVSTDDGERADPVILSLLKHARAEAAQDEARRLLYVALTRARDRLFLTASQRDRGLLALLEPALEAAGVACVEVPLDLGLAYPDPPLPTAAEHGLVAIAAPGGG